MINTRAADVLALGSLFLHVATPEDIEFERQAMEAAYGEKLKVFRVTTETRSGARVTRVEWEVM